MDLKQPLIRLVPWVGIVGMLWVLKCSHDGDIATLAVLREQTKVAEAQRDSALSALPSLEEAASRAVNISVALQDSLRRAQAAFDRQIRASVVREVQAVQRVAEAGAQVDENLDKIATEIPEPLLPLVDSTRAQLARERDAHRTVAEALREQAQATASLLAVTRQTLTAETLRADSQSALSDGLRAALSAETVLRESWETRARKAENPSLFAHLRRNLLPVGATLLAVVILR